MNILSTVLSFYDDQEKNSSADYNDCFKLPIEYLEESKLKLLNNNIISDTNPSLSTTITNPSLSPRQPIKSQPQIISGSLKEIYIWSVEYCEIQCDFHKMICDTHTQTIVKCIFTMLNTSAQR